MLPQSNGFRRYFFSVDEEVYQHTKEQEKKDV
jgi:hypothetical protein